MAKPKSCFTKSGRESGKSIIYLGRTLPLTARHRDPRRGHQFTIVKSGAARTYTSEAGGRPKHMDTQPSWLSAGGRGTFGTSMYIRMQHPNYIYILAQRSSKTHMCKENENVHTVCPRTQGSGSNRCRDAYACSKLNCSESATTSGRGWGPLSTYMIVRCPLGCTHRLQCKPPVRQSPRGLIN